MSAVLTPTREVVRDRVLERTNRRVRELAVEVHKDRVVLRGRADSFYTKQLALHGVRELLPKVALTNAIVVD
jgi:hypothetical protein